MALIFITGSSGTGKTSISLELRKHGFESYDTDDDGMARWRRINDSYIYPKSSVKAHQRTPEFIASHEWIVPERFIQLLGEKAINHHIFICGVIANATTMHGYFDRVFALTLDDQEIRNRLLTRTNNGWGKQSHELEQTLMYNRNSQERYKQLGYTVVDASKPLDSVLGEILLQVDLKSYSTEEPIDFVDFRDLQ